MASRLHRTNLVQIHRDRQSYLLQRKVQALLDVAAVDLQVLMKRQLSHPGGGRQYPSQPQPSSRPGQPPATQTGHLRRSIQIQRSGRLKVRVGTNLQYGLYLEVGTRKMAARPWVRPAIAQFRRYKLEQIEDQAEAGAEEDGGHG